MPIYDTYAPIYHAIGQGAFAEKIIARMLTTLPAPPCSALDLACGTGAAALALAAAGATVVGVDRSPQMLAIARGRARELELPVSFIEADLRNLPIATGPGAEAATLSLQPAAFQLITCLYDSLNYLTDDGDLAQVLARAAPLLVPGGRLIFDLNSVAEYATWNDSDQVVYDASDLLVYNRLSYDHARCQAQGRIVWFSRDGMRWWRGEEEHTQRAWAEAEVLAALEAAGLTLLARRTPQWAPAGPAATRIVYEAARA